MIKKITFLVLLLFTYYGIAVSRSIRNEEKNSLQVVIDNSLKTAIHNQSVEPLVKMEKSFSNKKGNLWLYWKAYIRMCKSVYYTSIKQNSKAKVCLEEGINILEQEQGRTTEDYALLGYMQSQYIRHTKGMESGVLSVKSKKNVEKSIELDSNNIRGWVVLGIIDYYTPKQYGGKEKCEYYLQKAIKLPPQNVSNSYRPSWGKIEAYSLLLAYYNESGQKSKLLQYYRMAIKEFPNETSFAKYGSH